MNDSRPGSNLVPLAAVTRSGRVESRHVGSFAVVRDGEVVHAWGDVEQPIYARSAVKPLQALPLVERGIAARLELSDRELAVTSASHNGTADHVEAVGGLLARGGFAEDDLLCGSHAPFDRLASLAIAKAGGKPRRIHNNCSGKHAGFLHLAADLGVDRADYLDPESASQALVRDAVGTMAGVDSDALAIGLDGCGAPTFWLPLVGLARAFANLANPDRLPDVRAAACRRLFAAISAEPVLLAGRGRLCTALVESAPGRIYPKNGAEGVYVFACRGADGVGYGGAVKVADGAQRGYVPPVIEVLLRLGLWPSLPPSLEEFRRMPIHNTQKLVVGQVESDLVIPSWFPG